MPPRPYVAILLVFWVAVALWFLQRELWPQFRPDAPPPFVVDFVDKVQKRSTDIRWGVTRNGTPDYFTASTSVEFIPSARCYDLKGTFGPNQKEMPPAQKFTVESTIRITRQGELRQVSIKVTKNEHSLEDQITIEGDVAPSGPFDDGTLALRWRIPREQVDQTLPPAEVALHGAVLNPYQPLGRIPGLHAGRRWRMLMIDPLGDPSHGVQYLQASVQPELHAVPWEGHDAPCWVVEFRDPQRVVAVMWVRESDGSVLRHDAYLGPDHWQLDRVKGRIAMNNPRNPVRSGS
jgi:hypothetical protein